MKSLIELKIDLMTNGINISPQTKDYLIKNLGEKFYNDDYVTTTGIMLELGDDVYVTSNMKSTSPYNLVVKDEKLYITKKEGCVVDNQNILFVKLWAPSKFMIEKTENKFGPITRFVNAHFDRARINPISGCSFHCAFCSMNEINYRKNTIEEMDEALKYALNQDKRITHVLISGGTPKKEDLPYLTQVYEYFCKTYPNINFDVMMTPRGFTSLVDETQYEDYLKYLKQIGVSGLSINIELFNDDVCKKYCKEKHEIGREKYLKFLKLASKVFGPMNVRSGLIVGLEEKQDTLEAVEEICKCGCLPMLSPYMPYNGIGTSPTTEFLIDVLNESMKIIEKYNLKLAPLCKKCRHNTI